MVQAPTRDASSGEERDRYTVLAPPAAAALYLSGVRSWKKEVFFCEVKRFVRKGVPNEHRAKIWMAASGAQEQLENHRGYYQSLLAVEHDPKLKETIHIGEPRRDCYQAHVM